MKKKSEGMKHIEDLHRKAGLDYQIAYIKDGQLKTICPECKQREITPLPGAKWCDDCTQKYIKEKILKTCPECGKEKDIRARLCNDCQLKQVIEDLKAGIPGIRVVISDDKPKDS